MAIPTFMAGLPILVAGLNQQNGNVTGPLKGISHLRLVCILASRLLLKGERQLVVGALRVILEDRQ